MERLERLREAYKAQLARMAEEAKQQEEPRRQTEREGKALEGEIKNPHYRYGQALAQHYNVRNPYGSLARSAMAEYGAFLRDRERLDLAMNRGENAGGPEGAGAAAGERSNLRNIWRSQTSASPRKARSS